MNMNGTVCGKIAEITTHHAERCDSGSSAAGAVIECIVGAATPMVASMFNGGTLQERLLFTLVLTGACVTLDNSVRGRDNVSLSISITPEALSEAFRTFTRLTGSDIRPHLPKSLLDFAGRSPPH